MKTGKKILMVVGSPKGRESASHTMADYVVRKLAKYSSITEILHVSTPALPAETKERYHTLMDAADAVILFFPLYADQLPSGLVKFLEDYSDHRNAFPPAQPQSLMAVVNSGFPEAHQNDQAVEVAQFFAESVGFQWKGALTLGGGGMIPAKGVLEKGGGRVVPVVRALSSLALCFSQDEVIPIPESVIEKVRKPAIPNWLYRFMADWGFKAQAKEHGMGGRVKAQPYLMEGSMN
jgi:multimeric flavodoxin WrbA